MTGTPGPPPGSRPEPAGAGGLPMGERIRRLRRERGLTQSELGGNRLSKGFLSQVESGRSHLSAESLAFVAERLGVPVSALQPGTDSTVEGEYLLRAVEAAVELGQAAQAEVLLGEVRTLLGGVPSAAAEIERLAAETAIVRGDLDGAVECALAALAAAPSGSPEVARACAAAARAHLLAGRPAAALLFVERALSTPLPLEAAGVAAGLLAARAAARLQQGDAAGAAADFAETLRLCEAASGDAVTALVEAARARSEGRLALALAGAERARTLAEEAAGRRRAAEAALGLGQALDAAGDPGAAAALEAALEEAVSLAEPRLEGLALERLATLAQRSGDLEQARGHARRAVLLGRQTGEAVLLARALLASAEAADSAGEGAAADALIAEAESLAGGLPPAERRLLLLRAGGLLRARGDVGGAVGRFEAAAALRV